MNEPMFSDPLRIVVASKNPVKIEAARRGFSRVMSRLNGSGASHTRLRVESLSVPSGVSDQPFSDAETLKGARQRAVGARQRMPEAEFWVGMEGGIEDQDGLLLAGAWIVILGAGQPTSGADSPLRPEEGRARTANFALPKQVAERVRGGVELGTAIDQVFDRQGAKRGPGAAGLLTLELIGRADLYEPAVILALAPFMLPEIYSR